MNTIDKIRAEIERRKKENMYDELLMTIGRYYEDRDLLAFIDSMPEETAPKGYNEAYLNECIAKASKTWEGVDVDKYMDEVRGNRPLSSDNSLGNEIERFTNDIRAEIIKWQNHAIRGMKVGNVAYHQGRVALCIDLLDYLNSWK